MLFPWRSCGAARQLADRSPREKRLVVRSHGNTPTGANPKNPGMMTEDRVSLLLQPEDAAQKLVESRGDRRASHLNSAFIRMANVLDPAEGDLLVTQAGAAVPLLKKSPAAILTFSSSPLTTPQRRWPQPANLRRQTLINVAAGTGAMPTSTTHFARREPASDCSFPKIEAVCDALRYNWTLSSDRAKKDLGWATRKIFPRSPHRFSRGQARLTPRTPPQTL